VLQIVAEAVRSVIASHQWFAKDNLKVAIYKGV
jgi:hypothetical protein